MARRCTVTLTCTRTFRLDAPDDMTTRSLQDLIDKEADRLLSSIDIAIGMNVLNDVPLQMVRDTPRAMLRVSDDRKRITDEEVLWAGEGAK